MGFSHRRTPTANGGSQKFEMVPPDGGWGWMVVLGNCMIMFCVSTVSFGYGMIYVALVEQQNFSNTAATGITALILGITSIMGPFATALATYYSHRSLALIGVFFAFSGLVLASLWLNLVWLYFCFALTAFGNAMATPQTFVIGQKYFVDKRVTVNSIASMAFTCGYVLIPILLHYLIQSVSIKGTLMLWASIMLHGAIGACLYQPVQRHLVAKPILEIPLITINDSPVMEAVKSESESLQMQTADNEPSDNVVKRQPGLSESLLSLQNGHNHDHNFRSKEAQKRVSFLSAFSEESFHTVKSHFPSLELLSIAPSEYFNAMGSIVSLNSIDHTDIKPSDESPQMDSEDPSVTDSRPLSPCLFCGFILPSFFDIFHFKLLLNPVFAIVSLGSTMNRQIYYGYLSLLPVVAKDLGFKEQTPLLLMALAGFEITTKIVVALGATRKGFPDKILYMAASLTMCISLFAMPFVSSFVGIFIGTAALGVGTGIASCIGPVLLVKYLGIKMLPYSYGMVLLMSGILSFIIFPLQGLTIDLTGSTATLCMIFSLLGGASFFLWLLMPLALRYQRKKTQST